SGAENILVSGYSEDGQGEGENLDNSENREKSENQGNPDNSENSDNQGNPDNSENPENPDNQDIEGDNALEKKAQSDTEMLKGEKFPLPLNVYGQQVEITLGEAASAIQRGLAFDRVKGELAQAKNDDRLAVLSQLAQTTGKSEAQLLARLQCDCVFEQLEESYGSVDNAPPSEVERAFETITATRKRGESGSIDRKRQEAREQLAQLLHSNPEVKQIPDCVIKKVQEGELLVNAYDRYRISQLEGELEKAELELKAQRHRQKASRAETPSLCGNTGAAMGAQDVYEFFKKMW
ncbi:MAG: hypothetical protein RSE24_05610, partial [Oscillospiraceae bacterium]